MQMQCPLDLTTLRGLLVWLELELRATTRYLNDLDLHVDQKLAQAGHNPATKS